MLVSWDVDEAMIGMDFLHSHETMWLLNKGKLIIDGLEVRLHSRRNKQLCRRIICTETVVIPALSQQDVNARMPLRNFNDGAEPVIIETKQLSPGVLLASTVLPGDETAVRIRVCNTNTNDVPMKAGTPVARAYGTTVLNQTTPREDNRRDEVQKVIRNLLQALPQNLEENIKRQTEKLLNKYK